MGDKSLDRRKLLKGTLAAGSVLGLSACASSPGGRVASAATRGLWKPRLVPMRVTPDQLIDVKCCIRPLRAAGPNLATEMVGDTLIVHNYGHGGSGWSLSWGSAEIAVGKALSVLPGEIAVVGCGIIGLTSAVMAQRAGLKVTIYARDMIQRTRSFRAMGGFTPDSRVALTEPAGPDFPALWERMTRFSWKAFRTYLGVAGNPVEFGDSYAVSDTPIQRHREPDDPAIKDSFATTGMPHQDAEFIRLNDRIRDIMPQSVALSPEENPFPTAYATRSSAMHFNFASYGDVMLREFFEAGGKFVMRDFHSPAEMATLKEKVVIHCTGYAARDLWQDKTIIPVRGQTGWLVPQEGVTYGVRMAGASLTAKGDGIVVMHNPPDAGDMYGVGDTMELPDREDILGALATLAPVFAKMSA